MLSRPECTVSCTGDPPEDKRQITPPRAVTLVPGLPSFGSKAASRSNILLLHLSFQVLCFFSSHPQLISGTPAPANSLGLVVSTPVSKGMRSLSTKDNRIKTLSHSQPLWITMWPQASAQTHSRANTSDAWGERDWLIISSALLKKTRQS